MKGEESEEERASLNFKQEKKAESQLTNCSFDNNVGLNVKISIYIPSPYMILTRGRTLACACSVATTTP